MKLLFAIVFSIFLTSGLSAQWVPWQIPTPRQTLTVPSDGTSISYPNVSLPVGMNYHVHADGWIYYDGSNDVADACFFNNLFLHISPDIGGKLGLKIKTAPSSENWFYVLAGRPNYNQGHTYNASIASTGNFLSIRYFDTDEPSVTPQNYGDNSGYITVEVAQETPRVAVQFDTIYFPNVAIGGSLRKVDSIESYGILGYRVDNVSMTGPSAAKFTPSSQIPTPFTIVETTNEFEFVYRPTAMGADTAYFTFNSSNAYAPDQHKTIVLIGNGLGAQLSVKPDTLHFGAVAVTTAKTLTEKLYNTGSVGANVTSITMTSPGKPYSVTPTSATLNAHDSASTDVTFSPIALGTFIAEFTCVGDEGSIFKFYADGTGIGAQLSVKPDTLHFGVIAVSATKTLTEKIYNSGAIGANITSIKMTTPAMPYVFTPSSLTVNAFDSASVDVIFSPVAEGTFVAEFTCTVSDGSILRFYAEGTAGKAIPSIDKTVLDFGLVILGKSRNLTSHISNLGNVRLFIDSTVNSNPLEYSVLGAQGPHFYDGGGSGEIYTFIFRPVVHLPGWQNHDGSFTFYYSDGTTGVITFKGADHQPLTARLSIDTNYFANPGKEITVYQRILDPLDSTLSPERSVSERIGYDPAILDFVRVEKATVVSQADWKLTSTPGLGTIDISLAATTERFGPAGPLLKVVFKVHPDVFYDTTYITQSNITFFDPIEPLASSFTGRIIIGDECTPVSLTRSFNPTASSIDQNNPNPVTSTTEVSFGIANADGSAVEMKLYLVDAMGRLVKILLDEQKSPGYYKLKIDAFSLPAGVYHCILDAGSYRGERTMVVIK